MTDTLAFDIKPCDATEADFKLLDLPYHWRLQQGIFEYAGVPSVTFWQPTSLAAFLEGMHRIAGSERFAYIMQAQGRLSEQADWDYISSFPNFFEGLRGINRVAVTAGWGLLELIRYDRARGQAVMRVHNAWEALCQKSLGVCWGTHYFAGKLAGWFSREFKTDCWCTQTAFFAGGDPWDEFAIGPSTTTVEQELARIDAEEKARQANLEALKRQKELEQLVEQRTGDLRGTIERLQQAQASLQAQAVTIERLSFPIVQVWDSILLVSLVGDLTDDRAQQLVSSLLNAVSDRRAQVVIIDVTGVSMVDTAVANHLLRTVQSVRLLGAQSLLVGVSPQIAQSLVHLGVDLSGLSTPADLQQGMKQAMSSIGLSIVKTRS